MIFRKKPYTLEQLMILKRRQIIADIILIIFIIGLGTYVLLNIEEIKGVTSGELNPCYICEKSIGAVCSLNGKPTAWSEEQASQLNNFSFNYSNLPD